ncbi:5-methyltetrahydropteroyltriglutamate--homocysteine S-methyltransferase [Marinobacter sp.]|uniref:5-methyltetrahydropteroyltriglutamate-- homocysteine S-methyltransferase n=1 Tax=Marinobacter sp. TaxID=50741 RepID=UPI00385010AD
MVTLHYIGVPRIGPARELKWATESYWHGRSTLDDLRETGRVLRQTQWERQRETGAAFVTVGDFTWYDQILEQSLLLGIVPERFRDIPPGEHEDRVFSIARGASGAGGKDHAASPMRKWFDTNYHYLVPEWDASTRPALAAGELLAQIGEAREVMSDVKVQLAGPATYLWLSDLRGLEAEEALDRLIPVYQQLLTVIQQQGVAWVQLDEPILCLDLSSHWRSLIEKAYNRLAGSPVPLLVATYFGGLEDNLSLALQLPVAGIHVDLVSAPDQLTGVLDRLGPNKVLSAGVINGRNIWRADLDRIYQDLAPAHDRLGDRLWLSTSCSLLHVPYSASGEADSSGPVTDALAFMEEKQLELGALARRMNENNPRSWQPVFTQNRQALDAIAASNLRTNPEVAGRLAAIQDSDRNRSQTFPERKAVQHQLLRLPPLPTTTIGSFPQTADIRRARQEYRQQMISEADYHCIMEAAIRDSIKRQELIGLDVLVHGEPERNDMVEYFSDALAGYTTTRQGWVQSYGTRCVKPPVIYGDIYRECPLTLPWAIFAQSLSDRPVKAMLTGPTTMVAWAFVREDQPLASVTDQIALALRDEIAELEKSGLKIIQVDEPALREKLPLRKSAQAGWLEQATGAFRLATAGVAPETQIHTHMCYSRFGDILEGIKALDADVITIEAARSDLALLEELAASGYAGDLGPGIYDIHSPLVPNEGQLTEMLENILAAFPAERLWINPDCGLKTRGWPEVEAALSAMVGAARNVRSRLLEKTTEASA